MVKAVADLQTALSCYEKRQLDKTECRGMVLFSGQWYFFAYSADSGLDEQLDAQAKR
jgi:hypothetical protein